MSKKDIQKVRALVQNAKRGERVVSLCLRGDIQLQIEELEKQLIKLKEADDLKSLGGNPEALPIAEQIEALIEEAKESTIDVLFRALPRREWADLVAEHPPKSDDFLFDPSTIYNDAVPACWVEPELDRETIDKLLDELTQGQWDLLVNTVGNLNRGDQKVPFSALASRVRKTSGETSKSLAPSG